MLGKYQVEAYAILKGQKYKQNLFSKKFKPIREETCIIFGDSIISQFAVKALNKTDAISKVTHFMEKFINEFMDFQDKQFSNNETWIHVFKGWNYKDLIRLTKKYPQYENASVNDFVKFLYNEGEDIHCNYERNFKINQYKIHILNSHLLYSYNQVTVETAMKELTIDEFREVYPELIKK